MSTTRIWAAGVAALSVAGLLAGCGKDSTPSDSPVAFSPVTGEQFTANPGAFQTDGVAVPPKSVMMVGDPVAAQAVVNAGLPQGTVTSTSDNISVYYPPVPEVPGLAAPVQRAVPEPMSRPADFRPYEYTPNQLDAYRAICDTGRWGGWVAGVERQTQVCWNLYGRQLGVRPWTPDQPRYWERPGYPKPCWQQGYRPDVPVMWVYPRSWAQPKPQPIISVSITINLGNNPYRKVNPRFNEPFYPVWAVTPGRVVDVRDQGRILAPVYTVSTTTTTTTTTVVSAPVAPGIVLAPLPTSAKVQPVLALPGAPVPGNANVDAAVTTPVPAALNGAVIQSGSVAGLDAAIGTSVSAAVAKTTTTTTTATTTNAADTSTAAKTADTTSPGSATPGTTSDAPESTSTAAAPSGARVGPATETTTAPSSSPTTVVAPPTTAVPTTTFTVPTTTVPTTTVPVPTTTVPVPTTRAVPTTTVPVPTTTKPVPTTTVPVPTTTKPVPTTTVPVPTTTNPVPTTTVPTTTVPTTTTTAAAG